MKEICSNVVWKRRNLLRNTIETLKSRFFTYKSFQKIYYYDK